MDKPVKAAFERDLRIIPIEDILPMRQVEDRVLRSVKYRRIARSIAEVGVIEPLVVARPRGQGPWMLLDGHVRLSILKELGERDIRCLVSDDDEAFTYNRRVNRLATIQEHYMIVRALERGVPAEKLARALDVDVKAIQRKRDMLCGICPEVVELLKDRSVNPSTFTMLRKIRAVRQIEAAELMISAGNFTGSYARALLAATRQSDLVQSHKPKKIGGMTPEQMARMEREMASLTADFRTLEASYGDDVLHLVIASGYLSRLVANPAIEQWLAARHPEILSGFRSIISVASLDAAAAEDDDDDEGSSAEDDGADETSPWPRPRRRRVLPIRFRAEGAVLARQGSLQRPGGASDGDGSAVQDGMLRTIPLLLMLTACVPVEPAPAGRASVIDGDTLEIQGQRVRIWGVDAPEGRQTCGEPDGGTWRCGTAAANALEGRRQALRLLVKRKAIKRTHPVRVIVDADNDAHEISLDENITREAMHPADQFEAFRRLADEKGYGPEEIGARFGVSAHVVRQRLRLGAAAPELMAAYREGTLALDQLTAFCVSEDQDRQRQVLEQIGQVGDGTSVQEMIAIAAQGAGEFASEIAANDPEAALILSAFAMATDEAVGLDELTLAFVLNGPVKARPAHRARLSRVVEVFGRTPAESFPEYKTLPVLTPLQMAKIELLENRQILVRSAYRLQLSHGFYRAAALGLLRQPAAATVTRHLGLMQRGLFCLDPRVSRATARNLARVWAAVPETARPKVVDLAADGLSALYPGTRDLSWRFLIAHLDRISERVRSDLPQWIRNTYSTDLDDLAWRNGEAWIRSGGASFSDSRYFRRTKLDAAQPILEGLEGEAEYAVQPENADTALSYYSARPRRMNARAIRRLLALDEAVLRGDAAKTWVTVPRANDADILDQIFAERHPRIAGDVLDGLADGWAKLSKKRRADLVARMKVFIASPAVAVPLVDTLVLINRVEHFGDDPPWALFGALLPTLLDQLTDEGTGAEPRLFTAVDDAVRHLPASVIVDICRSWIGWLTRTTRRQLRSDYAWGVVSILIDATRATPALRDGLLEPLFAHVDETGAAVMLVSEMSYEWDDLTDAERDLLRTLFRAPRRDALWLKAVALTRRSPSDTLVMELIGASLARTARGVIGQLPPDLLDACIEVHLGVEPFGHLGLNCQRRPPWRRIVQRLAADPGHRLGFLCLEALVQEENARRLRPVMPSWIGRLDEIFELLLRHHLRVAGGSDLRAIWIWVFAHASPAQKAAWDKRLSQTVVGLIDELRELDRHLGLDFPDIPQTTAVISPDYHAMVFVSDIVREPSITPAGLETMLQVIIDTVLGLAPVLYGTLDYVSAVLKTKENREHPPWESLKAPRDAALKVHWSIREQRLPVRVVDKGRWKGPM